MLKPGQYILILLGVLGLVMVRYFEQDLFYDPLMFFFQGDYRTQELPPIDAFAFGQSLILRFFLNMVFGLLLIKGWFQKISLAQFTILIGLVFFLVLAIALIFLLTYYQVGHYHQLFYVRRFLIHPIIILILLPAFYFYQPQ